MLLSYFNMWLASSLRMTPSLIKLHYQFVMCGLIHLFFVMKLPSVLSYWHIKRNKSSFWNRKKTARASHPIFLHLPLMLCTFILKARKRLWLSHDYSSIDSNINNNYGNRFLRALHVHMAVGVSVKKIWHECDRDFSLSGQSTWRRFFRSDLYYRKWAMCMTWLHFGKKKKSFISIVPMGKMCNLQTAHDFCCNAPKKLAKTVPKGLTLAWQATYAQRLGNFLWQWGLRDPVSFPPDANVANRILREAQSHTPHGMAVARLVLWVIQLTSDH